MILFFLKSLQQALFDMPVRVAGSVDKHGVVRKPHTRIQKVALKKPPHVEPIPQVDMFAGHDSPVTLDMFDHAPSPRRGDESNNGEATKVKNPPSGTKAPAESGLPIVEHVTKGGKGKTLRGVIVSDKALAESIDQYTFRKDGGWFVREKHLVDGRLPEREASAQPTVTVTDYHVPFNPSAVTAFGVSAGVSKAERVRLNNAAMQLLRNKSPEDMSAEDRDILSKYSGNGGTGDSLNEFYTDTAVAAAMWKSLFDLGLPPGASVLEPSCATGVFMHTAPDGVRVTGVEMDPTSSQIAGILHGGRHEVRNASLERFATSDDRQFDAVIGNPPFGLRGSLIKDDKPDLSTAESYFIDTALDKCKAGGIVALIVPTGVMDSKSGRSFRERMLRKGEFLGAMRMPNTAFEHAHTGVTTDVIYLRKRPDDVAGALMTVPQETLRALGAWDEHVLAGTYFTDGPGKDAVLGTMTEGWRSKAGMGQDITVEGSMHGVPEAIAAFRQQTGESKQIDMPAILSALGGDEKAKERAIAGSQRQNYGQFKVGDTKVVDGVTYILQGNPPRWHRVEDVMEADAVRDGVALAEEIDRLMTGKSADRQQLEADVRAYIKKHGIPSRSDQLQAAASHNKVLFRLIGAVKPDGSLSDVVTGAVRKVENTFDSAAQALSVEVGRFTPAQLAERWGKGDEDEALDHLYASKNYALNTDGTWSTMDDYLSGELWPKLDAAREKLADGELSPLDRGKFEAQAKALDEAIDPASLEDVFIQVNQAWIPTSIVAEFFTWRNTRGNEWQRKLEPVQITYDGGVYSVTGGNTWGDTKLLDKYLNRTGVKKDDLPTIAEWNQQFKEWLCASAHRDQIEDAYNRKFRGFRAKEYSNVKFDIPGLNDQGLKDYQYGGLRWALANGKGIIAADVGLGKTARGLMLARMAKVSGQAQRPMIVVPKSVLANWYAEVQKWFPGARTLVIGESYTTKGGEASAKEDGAAERKRKYHDMTQNDYDFILISQPAFNELDVDPATKNSYLSDDFWVQRGEKLGNAGDKRIKKVRESFEQSAASREFDKRTDAIYFNDLGVDMLIMDEMHAYKNLYSARNRFGESPKFLGGQGQSNRAFDMSFKARWIREQTGGKNIYGLTATPTKNSPLEIYSMLSYIAPEAFEKIGIRNSEEFLDRFCRFERENILGTSGDIEESLVVAGFQNMDELREIMRRYIDRTTAADVGLKLPERDDHMHLVDMDPAQQAEYVTLREQADESSKKDATGDAHIFSIMDKMSKAAMDLELLDPVKYAGHVSPKYREAAKRIVDGSKDGGQVVFADFLGAHDKLVNELVKSGIPRNQIGVINAQVAGASSKRQKISDDFNAGKLKVVIGNTATMGEGINLQKATTDIHHLDLPWEPASIQQRNGRGLRQGNVNEAVRIHTYLSKGSFDGYKYQTVSAKKDWQDLLWTGGNEIENYNRSGSVGREDMLIMLAADPEAARQQYAANKESAKQRFEAEQRRSAAGEYVRFQSMGRSLAGLKNKGTAAATRLSQSIERIRAGLRANKHFQAKELLEDGAVGLVHPDTGAAVTVGTYIAPGEGSKLSKDPLVVTAVDPVAGAIKVRNYGKFGQAGWWHKLSEVGSDAAIRRNDDAAESAEMKAKAEEAARANASTGGGLQGPKDAAGLPPETMRELYPSIQSTLKELAKGYRGNFGHGRVGMLDKDGNPVGSESYAFRNLLDTHDFMLPSDEHREKAIRAYIADEKAKTFSMEFKPQSGRRRNSFSNERVFVSKYPGAWDQKSNQWAQIGRDLFGDGFEDEARKRMQDEVLTAARRAGALPDMFRAVRTLARVAPYGGAVTIPKRALATLYAKAKREGMLDAQAREALVPDSSNDGRILPMDVSLGDSLRAAARSSGHDDLYAAMVVDTMQDDPKGAVLQLVDRMAKTKSESAYSSGIYMRQKSAVSWPRDGLDAIKHIIDKHPEIGSMTPEDFDNGAVKFRVGIGYDNGTFSLKETLRQSIDRAYGGGNG